MKLWKYVFIGLMGVLLVACGNGGIGNKAKTTDKNTNQARKVISCSSQFLFGIASSLKCFGDTQDITYDKDGNIRMLDLYHQGWKIDSDVSRADSFMFILSK